MKLKFPQNRTRGGILLNMLIAFVSLFVNGFGVYLTIHADIGSAPWDVLNIGLSKSLGVLYGTASIAVSLTILLIDVGLREAIGVAMLIDAFTVGKAVDFFNMIDVFPSPKSTPDGICMTLLGLVVIGYTQYTYMAAALGCGPRDTLIVGVTRHIRRVPIGIVSVVIQSAATLIGWLLGGPVGIGTIICAFCAGPIMQFAFRTVHFNATSVTHQKMHESVLVFIGKAA